MASEWDYKSPRVLDGQMGDGSVMEEVEMRAGP